MNFSVDVELQRLLCAECGIFFAVPAVYWQWLAIAERPCYCPNGHGIVPGKPQRLVSPEELRLQHENDQLQAQLEALKGAPA